MFENSDYSVRIQISADAGPRNFAGQQLAENLNPPLRCQIINSYIFPSSANSFLIDAMLAYFGKPDLNFLYEGITLPATEKKGFGILLAVSLLSFWDVTFTFSDISLTLECDHDEGITFTSKDQMLVERMCRLIE